MQTHSWELWAFNSQKKKIWRRSTFGRNLTGSKRHEKRTRFSPGGSPNIENWVIFLPLIFLRWIHLGGSYLWVHGSRILQQFRTILADLCSLTGDMLGRGYPQLRKMQMGLANGAPAEFIPCGNPLTPLCPRSGLGSGLTGVLPSGSRGIWRIFVT